MVIIGQLFYTIDVCNFFLRRVRRLSSFRDSQQMIWSFLSLSLRVPSFLLIQLRICSALLTASSRNWWRFEMCNFQSSFQKRGGLRPWKPWAVAIRISKGSQRRSFHHHLHLRIEKLFPYNGGDQIKHHYHLLQRMPRLPTYTVITHPRTVNLKKKKKKNFSLFLF